MTPWQVVVLAVGGVWVGWLIVRLLLLWSRVARQGVARAVAPGRPTLRLEFPPSVWLEIMEGPRLGWLAEDLAGVIDELSEAPPTLRLGERPLLHPANAWVTLT